MHRNRFAADKDARWFSFSILESAQFGSLNLNICWNHLFNQDWDRDTAMISTGLNLSNGIYLRPGIMANFTSYIEYIPFLFLSMVL